MLTLVVGVPKHSRSMPTTSVGMAPRFPNVSEFKLRGVLRPAGTKDLFGLLERRFSDQRDDCVARHEAFVSAGHVDVSSLG